LRTFTDKGGRSLQMRTSALFGAKAKNFGFFEIYGVSARAMGEGGESVWAFCGHGDGLILSNFVWTSFMDGSLDVRRVACYF